MKKRAELTLENSNDIIAREISVINERQAINMPNIKSMATTIRRTRKKIQGGELCSALDIPGILKFDDHGNLFVRKDTGFDDSNRIVIFLSKQKENILQKCKTFLVDGTFKSTPHNFYQTLIIHGCVS
jgi:hypothetical protein